MQEHAWGQVYHYHIPANLPHTTSLTCLPSYSAHQSGLPPQPSCGDPQQAGVRSSIITFDVYVIPNIFEKYDNRRPDPLCPATWLMLARAFLERV